MRQYITTALTIVGAVVGAGFASGREVYQFFSRFGAQGMVGVLVATFLLTGLSVRVLVLARKYRAQTFVELMQQHLGKKYALFFKIMLLIALWLGLGVMLSGAGAAGESLGLSQAATIGFTALITTICLYTGIKAVKKVNALLIPVLIAISGYIFYQGMSFGSSAFLLVDSTAVSWTSLLWSAIIYAGFNSLLVFVVIPPLLQEGRALGVIVGCGIFGVLLLCITLLLLQFPVLAATSPIPMLSITTDIAPKVPALYGVIMWTALTTTALANGIGLVDFLACRFALSRLTTSFGVALSSMPLAFLPFEHLVANIYTGLGYVALFVVAAIVSPGRYKRAR